MFSMSGFRPPTLQQIPCKTINDITYPPARISNVPLMSGYKSVTFGHGMKVPKEYRLFHSPEFKLNNPILKSPPTFFVR